MKQLLICSCLLLVIACTTDSYETGEGRYSQTTADFSELRSNGQKQGISFLTDEGVNYIIENAVKASWIKTADSIYRTSIYYNKVSTGSARVVSCVNIPTLRPKDAAMYKQQPQDPVEVESCWLTKSGKYLNLGLLMKNGRNSEGHEGTHALGLALDEIHQNADNTQTAYYRLLHDQGTAPEYYTNRQYASILLPTTNRPDSVRLTIKTYKGTYVKTLKIK